MAIKFRTPTKEELVDAPAVRLGDGSEMHGVVMVAECDADHCTEEERAVINAAVEDRVTFKRHVDAKTHETFREYAYKNEVAGKRLSAAVDALLAARQKAET